MTLSAIRRSKEEGKKIVFAWGCFDLFHVGHANFLEECKKRGEVLLVGVNSDQIVKRRKGRLIFGLKARMALIGSLKCVDAVIELKETNLVRILKAIGLGVDWVVLPIEQGREPEFKGIIREMKECFPNVKIRRIRYKTGVSTTKVIAKVKTL